MSKLNNIFTELQKQGLYTLRGDTAIVEELPREEVTTKSGLFTHTSARSLEGYSSDKPMFVRVLQVGAGYKDDDGNTIECDFVTGDILLVGPIATVRWYSDIFGIVANMAGCRLGVMQAFSENAFMTFKDDEAYAKAYSIAGELK